MLNQQRKPYPFDQTVAEALFWLVRNAEEQPDLDDLANQMGLSPGHAQRRFQHSVGVSPKKFLQYLTREAAMDRLSRGATVLDAAYDSGLSSPGRLHDLLVSTTALTPGEARRRGQGLEIEYGFGPSPFGLALIAWTARGIVFLAFCQGRGKKQALSELQATWPQAQFINSPSAATWLSRVFAGAGGSPTKVWLHGSPFQLKVWEALLRIPEGTHVTYGHLATSIGQSGAARAVGSAVGANTIAWLIPCHRVIGQLGTMTGYRWGIDVKRTMIAVEAARVSA